MTSCRSPVLGSMRGDGARRAFSAVDEGCEDEEGGSMGKLLDRTTATSDEKGTPGVWWRPLTGLGGSTRGLGADTPSGTGAAVLEGRVPSSLGRAGGCGSAAGWGRSSAGVWGRSSAGVWGRSSAGVWGRSSAGVWGRSSPGVWGRSSASAGRAEPPSLTPGLAVVGGIGGSGSGGPGGADCRSDGASSGAGTGEAAIAAAGCDCDVPLPAPAPASMRSTKSPM